MKALIHRLLIVCCALYLSGAHWAVLQATAWTGMIVARSQTAAMSVAMEETFDGEHPCRMCVAIQKGHEEEKEQERKLPAAKKVIEIRLALLDWFELPASALSGEMHWRELTFPEIWRTDAPPVPPPLA